MELSSRVNHVQWILTAVAAVLAILTSVWYLYGWATASTHSGTCDAWASCSFSARHQWVMTSRSVAVAAIAFAGMLAAFLPLWRTVAAPAPVLRLVFTVITFAIVTLVTVISGFFALAVLGAECGQSDFLCFSGPDDAAVFATPAFVATPFLVTAGVGIFGRRTRTGRICSTVITTLALDLIVGIVVASLAAALFAFTG